MSAGLDGESDLRRLFEEGRRIFPRIVLDEETFTKRAAEAGLERARSRHAAELYLAFACASGLREAIDHFEAEYVPIIARAVARVRGGESPEDLVQKLRALLLIGRSERGPLIARYAARGTLASWLGVVAVREALATRSSGREISDDAALADAAVSSDQELQYLRQLYAPELLRAFQSAFATLSPKERNMLRYVYVDGLDATAVGKILKVHRTTASRQIARVHELLSERTRERLIDLLGVEQAELESIIRLVQSQLQISLSGL